MTGFGLDLLLSRFPSALRHKRLGVLCHAASITSGYEHIIDALSRRNDCTIAAIFGPQHGLYGQTQDNMIEWEGARHPRLKVPVYSLYGKTRKPSPRMLENLDAFIIDLQDVGARPYTYVWTVKLCIEACAGAGIPVWILDRPNPIAALGLDGPMLSPDYFTFVGGACIPLCHRMTMGEMALLVKQTYYPDADVRVIAMKNWWRDSLWNETGLPWVLPSPNMPMLETAIVYPGMVFFEALNASEGRGTSRPFELFGAPYLKPDKVLQAIARDMKAVPGFMLREHGFIPTFNKWHGVYCNGFQIQVTDPRRYRPVLAATAIISAIMRTSGNEFAFKPPPYEYEMNRMPFDILAGDDSLRRALQTRRPVAEIREGWMPHHRRFKRVLEGVSLYPERRP